MALLRVRHDSDASPVSCGRVSRGRGDALIEVMPEALAAQNAQPHNFDLLGAAWTRAGRTVGWDGREVLVVAEGK